MADRVLYLNGNLVPESEAQVSLFDRGFTTGDAVFDVVRTFQGKPYKLRAHLERLYRSLAYVRIAPGLTLEEMERISEDVLDRNRPLLKQNDEYLLYQRVSRGPGLNILSAGPPTVAVYCMPMSWGAARYYRLGCHAIVAQTRQIATNTLDPKVKTQSRMHMNMAYLEAKTWDPDAYPLMLDAAGNLTEGAGTNLFLVREGRILTADASNVLEGLSRDTLLDLASESGFEVIERSLQPYDLFVADEAFLTATSFCLLPITRFNGVQVCGGVPGPIARKLLTAWSEKVGVDIAEQALSHLTPEARRALDVA
jgi:branched-chain amino acid aminotransferase